MFLILEPKYRENGFDSYAFDEVLYTGITRSRLNFVIINFGNKEYDEWLRNLVSSINDKLI